MRAAGGCIAEPACTTRTPFQRDRDRILHATAFRRLTHKTQVFVFHEGDHYRTRLTHSLEVAQIARTVARQLRLDEDLAEAIALAHDLGHPPFGHAGERALDGGMQAFGGFDHNAQSLRVVTRLERKYASFDGLNLTGRRSRASPSTTARDGRSAGEAVCARPIARTRVWRRSLDLASLPPAEAQVAALADDIAYDAHDIDDGLRAGLIALADLRVAAGRAAFVAERAAPDDRRRSARIYEINRRMITAMIADLVRRDAAPACGSLRQPQPRRHPAGRPRRWSPSRARWRAETAGPQGVSVTRRLPASPRHGDYAPTPRRIVGDLFARYLAEPDAMPGAWARAPGRRRAAAARAAIVADFVAGMTDRYAIASTGGCLTLRRICVSRPAAPEGRHEQPRIDWIAHERLCARAKPRSWPHCEALEREGALPPGSTSPPSRWSRRAMPRTAILPTNAAMVLAKPARMKPRDIAEKLEAKLDAIPTSRRSRSPVRASSTSRLQPEFWQGVVAPILEAGAAYGRADIGEGERSTSSMSPPIPPARCTSGHCRGAVFGDALANLLAFAGYEVTREYYVNDAGGQVDILARSAFLRYREALGDDIGEIPAGLYPGDYLKPVGEALAESTAARSCNIPRSAGCPSCATAASSRCWR